MNGLKPCPFCGGEAETIKMGQYNGEIIYNSNGEPRIRPFAVIGCKDCGARIEEQDEEELADMWNTRTPEIVRCRECIFLDTSETYGEEDDEYFCKLIERLVRLDDFCSQAERRKENEKIDL